MITPWINTSFWLSGKKSLFKKTQDVVYICLALYTSYTHLVLNTVWGYILFRSPNHHVKKVLLPFYSGRNRSRAGLNVFPLRAPSLTVTGRSRTRTDSFRPPSTLAWVSHAACLPQTVGAHSKAVWRGQCKGGLWGGRTYLPSLCARRESVIQDGVIILRNLNSPLLMLHGRAASQPKIWTFLALLALPTPLLSSRWAGSPDSSDHHPPATPTAP